MNLEASDETDVFRGEIRHQHTTNGPVDDVDTTDIARADGNIESLVSTGCIEAWQVVGVVAEVSIHLEDVAVVTLQCPLESRYVGSAKTQFSAAFYDEETVAELLLCHHSLHDGCCPIR